MEKKESVVQIDTSPREVTQSVNRRDDYLGFNNFIQLNCDHIRLLQNMACNHGKELGLLLFLAENANKRNEICVCYRTLGERIGKSVSTVKRHMKYLKNEKLIEIKRSGMYTIVVINPHVIWKSKNANRLQCDFSKSIFIENDKKKSLPGYIGKML